MDRRLFLAAAIPGEHEYVTAIAQTAPPTRVRGTIAAVEGNKMTVTVAMVKSWKSSSTSR